MKPYLSSVIDSGKSGKQIYSWLADRPIPNFTSAHQSMQVCPRWQSAHASSTRRILRCRAGERAGTIHGGSRRLARQSRTVIQTTRCLKISDSATGKFSVRRCTRSYAEQPARRWNTTTSYRKARNTLVSARVLASPKSEFVLTRRNRCLRSIWAFGSKGKEQWLLSATIVPEFCARSSSR